VSALFLSPHPDDVELFCGGTVAALASSGRKSRIMIADLTRGELSSNGTVELRARESTAAAEALGLDMPRVQLGLPDAGLDARDAGQLRAIVELIRRIRPKLLFAPWIEDRHPDHVAAGELARRALFFAGAPRFEAAGEVFNPERLLYYPCHAGVEPTLLMDVSTQIGRWESAVRCYSSQFSRELTDIAVVETPINRPGFLDVHRARRAEWGSRIGAGYAEGFVYEDPWTVSVADLLKE
jgi:bacillithiol biosynthesis deacetylase BshB1